MTHLQTPSTVRRASLPASQPSHTFPALLGNRTSLTASLAQRDERPSRASRQPGSPQPKPTPPGPALRTSAWTTGAPGIERPGIAT